MMSLLENCKVHIKDYEAVKEKLQDLVTAGQDKLQVVADFDNTLTKHHFNGKKCQCCHAIVGESELMPDFYRRKTEGLLAKYYPIEVDPDRTIEEKTPYMVEWWEQAHSFLVESGLNRTTLEAMVDKALIHFRDGAVTMFDTLHAANIPLLIFSAGIGDVIQVAVRQKARMHPNMHIVSNFMKFDETGKICGFEGETIHVFNKNENAVHQSDYFPSLSFRDRVVLLGDGLGDLQMCEGMQHRKTTLTVGFLNDKIEQRLDDYKQAFDIVLVDDQTMEVPNAILQGVIAGQSPT